MKLVEKCLALVVYSENLGCWATSQQIWNALMFIFTSTRIYAKCTQGCLTSSNETARCVDCEVQNVLLVLFRTNNAFFQLETLCLHYLVDIDVIHVIKWTRHSHFVLHTVSYKCYMYIILYWLVALLYMDKQLIAVIPLWLFLCCRWVCQGQGRCAQTDWRKGI